MFGVAYLSFTGVNCGTEGDKKVLHKHLINLSMSFMRSRKICCERNSIREESKRRVNKQSKVIITTLNSCKS